MNTILTYYTARSNNSQTWIKNAGTWAEFLADIKRHRVRVKEITYKQFMRFGKDKQDELKNVGGYVGADLIGGNRKKHSVNERHLLTLDADFAPQGEDFVKLCTSELGCAFFVHSTIKHSDEAPRLRFIAPLKSPLDSVQYIALSRAVADKLNMEWFDHTCFQNERLMYWPTCTSNGEYFEHTNDGLYLDGEALLDFYYGKLPGGYENFENWPVHPNEKKKLHELKEKKQNPSESTDPTVRAFCAAYSIEEAIGAFLSEIYEKSTNSENRYTYTRGTSANGVVIYDNTFAYSNHESDPASGQLCNAFDLVRLHKFGDAKGSTNEMRTFVTQDSKSKSILIRINMNEAASEFSDFDDDDELDFSESSELDFSFDEPNDSPAPLDEYVDKLEMDKAGKFLNSELNFSLIFGNDPELKGVFVKNIITGSKLVRTSAPWIRELISNVGADKVFWGKDMFRPYQHEDPAAAQDYVIRRYNIAGIQKVKVAIENEFQRNTINVLAEVVRSFPRWDGVKRMDTLFIDYFGADDNPVVRETASIMLRAAVARALHPGTKYDLMVCLSGPEGCAKSQLVKELALNKYYNDSLQGFEDTKAFEAVAGTWYVEIPEGRALDNSDQEAVKAFLTKSTDTFRGAFKAERTEIPRTCIFVMTTNKDEFLQSMHKNRRFAPITAHPERFKSSQAQLDMIYKTLPKNIEQIYAEALHVYENEPGGKRLYYSDEVEELAQATREQYEEEDTRLTQIEGYLADVTADLFNDTEMFERGELDDINMPEPVNVTCTLDIYVNALSGSLERRNLKDLKYIRNWLNTSKDWVSAGQLSKRFGSGIGSQKYFVRRGSEEHKILLHNEDE